MDVTTFADSFIAAIAQELKTDTDVTNDYLKNYNPKQLGRQGLAIVNLQLSSARSGMWGKTLYQFSVASAYKDKAVDFGQIKVGDLVKVSQYADASKSFSATVTRLNNDSVTVASGEEEVPIEDDSRVYMVKITDANPYNRMTTAMNKLKEMSTMSPVIKLLLGVESYTEPAKMPPVKFINNGLNRSQQEAVEFSLRSPVSIVHGPPGTGKTHTIIEVILQCVARGERVLVCAPSNIAVDTLLERLSDKVIGDKRRKKKSHASDIIRVGHPARLLDVNLKHSLTALSTAPGDDNRKLVSDIQSDISRALGQLNKTKKFVERRQLYDELKQLRRERREREKQVTTDLVLGSKVVVSTLHGAGAWELTSVYKNSKAAHRVQDGLFDTVIIDEVSQSLEPQCWIPLVSHPGISRVVIAGDNKQLPPTVMGAEKLSQTLFDRLLTIGGEAYKKLLRVQYRMNKAIMEFPSRELYADELIADSSVCDISVAGQEVLVWYDTQGGDYMESVEEDGTSKYNDGEIEVVLHHISELKNAGVSASEIGIITPYSAQSHRLRHHIESLDLKIEISTVDGFQGREKEIIIISLVRSNDSRQIGFLRDERRLNVAMTRPKRQLCVVGDMSMLEQSNINFLENWADYVGDNFDVRYPDRTQLLTLDSLQI